MDEELDDYSARVLDVVDAIPPGQVMSYGDIAEYLGAGGPRQVGRVLATYGGGVAWWRVFDQQGADLSSERLAADGVGERRERLGADTSAVDERADHGRRRERRCRSEHPSVQDGGVARVWSEHRPPLGRGQARHGREVVDRVCQALRVDGQRSRDLSRQALEQGSVLA